MATTTISPKFQVIIPKEVRKKLNLRPGQKVTMFTKGAIIYCFPEKRLGSLRGFLKSLGTENIREDGDR